ncbi:hypothetical protein Trco_001948 [Trichoderma cornu-damae]|uniref:F-box domain-containing protein n=1 Tax=Trichoderma cornu-damae TaxID=654480 RepID=A0A9P8TXZ8_9HYPO|nr:hypothetical protein Trco_001948 [Trichoderma cornu-damae]
MSESTRELAPLSGYSQEELLKETSPPESKLGALGVLNYEVLHMVTYYLDFQSLIRLSQTCVAGFILLHDLPAYKDMVRYAPTVLPALGRSQLLKYHASSVIHQALRRESVCCCCQKQFGGYIFLPSFERLCFTCLNSNLIYRMVPYHIIYRYQLLTEAQRFGLRVMHFDSRFYNQRLARFRSPQSQFLVSVKELKRHTLLPPRPELLRDSAKWFINCDFRYLFGQLKDSRDYSYYRTFANHINDDFLWEEHQDFEAEPDLVSRNAEDYPGAAYMRFPHVSGGSGGSVKVEHGVACQGCWYAYELACDERRPRRFLRDAPEFELLDDCLPMLIDRDRLMRVEEFTEHVKTCRGIKIYRQDGEGDDE